MSRMQILGIVLLITGLVASAFAWHVASHWFAQIPSAASSIALIGGYANNFMWYLLLGAVAAVAGTLLSVFGGRTRGAL